MTTRIQPALVNQFSHMLATETPNVYDRGARWNVTHADDRGVMHNWDSQDCTAAVGAMLGFAQSGGTRHFGPGDIRLNQEDFSGGIGLDDVNVSFDRLGLAPLLLPSNAGRKVVRAWLAEGRAVGIGVEYGKVPRSSQAQKGGTFDHQFGMVGLFVDDTNLYDPLAKAIVRTPLSAIFPAAEALAQRERGDHDASRLFTGATKPLPLAWLQLAYGGQKTAKYPDRQRVEGKGGAMVNVHRAPRTGSKYVNGRLADGALFVAYQVTEADPFDGSTKWYGDKSGTRWVSAARLRRKGGST